MDNLIIGNTSQLSNYFPKDYLKISSRNIDKNFIKSKKWNRVFLCFGESRKFVNNPDIHNKINFEYTIEVINFLIPYCEKIIVYSTCELWNKYSGQIDLNLPFNFYETNYIKSKYNLTNHILKNDLYKNVIILFPFNFNSIYRTQDFLFGKIFYSIINKVKIKIGDTYFYRDMIHPKHVVEESIHTNSNTIVGSGRLVFVNDFIRDIYSSFNMRYDDYIIEEFNHFNEYEKRNEYYLKTKKYLYHYNNLLTETLNDIKNEIIKKS